MIKPAKTMFNFFRLFKRSKSQEDIYRNSYFYIYDRNNELVGMKDRSQVHLDGDWHRAVQLNIICENEILLQRRSSQVDIAKGLLDQSLATQLIVQDEEDNLNALKRGLQNELGITLDSGDLELIKQDQMIMKTYNYDLRFKNNEFITLYNLYLPNKIDFTPNPERVKELIWKNLDEVKADALKLPDKYTKTFTFWLKNFM